MKKRRATRFIVRCLVALFLLATLLSARGAFDFAATRSSAVAHPVADPAAVYSTNCETCHGGKGAGTPKWNAKGQPDLTSQAWQRSRSDAKISASIRNGGKFMPAFGKKLSADEIAGLVKLIRSFKS